MRGCKAKLASRPYRIFPPNQLYFDKYYFYILLFCLLFVFTVGCSQNSSTNKATDISGGDVELSLMIPIINIGYYNKYTTEQIQFLEEHNNTFLFSRDTDLSFRDKFSSDNKRGIYVNMMTILPSEMDEMQAFVATDPNTQKPFINPENDALLSKFWDQEWWQTRINMVQDLDTIDYLFLDSMLFKPFEWITTNETLDDSIDTDAEWRSSILNIIAYLRQSIPSNVFLVINSIRENYSNTDYDGFDGVGPGLAEYGVLEGFINNTGGDPGKQLRQMQIVSRAATLEKKIIVITKIDPSVDSSQNRIDYLSKYLLVSNPIYTFYMIMDETKWSPFPPLYFPELEIDFGYPVDPVPDDIITGDIKSSLLIRSWDSGYITLVNTSESPVDIPSVYSNYKMLKLSGDPTIDINGYTDARWELVPLSIQSIEGRQSLILYK